jgi:rRNA maturation protein Nop10
VLYECPHCQGDIYGEADTCPECGEGIDWSEDEPDKQEPEPDDEELEDEDEDDEPEETYYDCPWPDCDGGFHGEVDACPDCGQELEWEED